MRSPCKILLACPTHILLYSYGESLPIRFQEDKNEFLFRVNTCVRASVDRVYEPQASECTLAFTEPKPAHDDVIKRILYQHAQSLRVAGSSTGEGGEGAGEQEVDSDAEREAVMREEPDDDRAEMDDSRFNDILSSPEPTN